MDTTPLKGHAYRQALIKTIILYVTGSHDFEAWMDELGNRTTDKQWAKICNWLEYADDVEAEAGTGSVAQLEKYLARQEQRPHRFPNTLWVGPDDERERQILALQREFERRRLRFHPPHYKHIDPAKEPQRPPPEKSSAGFEFQYQPQSEGTSEAGG